MLPNLVIVGAPKAGTSSLFHWLADHPQVCGSKEKETYYFVDPGTHMYRKARNFSTGGLTGYEAEFPQDDPGARIIVEATPGYMYYETALRELPRLPTHPEIVFVLREPVAQIRSLFRYFQENWDWIPRSMTFPEFIEAVEKGTSTFKGNELASGALRNANYVDHLRKWREACGADRLHVFLFEDMIRDPRAFMVRLAARLGIDPAFYETYDFLVENGTYVVKNAALQSLNIRIRGLIPQGRIYEVLRRMYRAANTKSVPKSALKAGADDSAVERMLSYRYLPMVQELEQEFGLDLSTWRRALEARLSGPQETLADRSLAERTRSESLPSPDLRQF